MFAGRHYASACAGHFYGNGDRMSKSNGITFIRVPLALLSLGIDSVNDLLTLALVCGFNGNGFRMSARSLAEVLHIDLRSAKRVVKRLKDQGWVTVQRENGRRILRPAGDILTRKGDRSVTREGDQPVTQEVTDGSPPSDKKRNVTCNPPIAPQEVGVELLPASNDKRCATVARPDKRSSQRAEYTPAFERFWSEYPRKVGKLEAFREWQRLAPDDVLVEKIVTAVRAWRRSEQWAKDGGKFILYPVRFLKHRRFEDDLPCSPDPQFGDPDWVPTDEELEARKQAWQTGETL